MVFGLFAKSDEDRRADEVRTGAVAPSRIERARCWEARDAYYACLDRADIVDAVRDDKAARRACGRETAQFEADCATQWVKYFKEKRVADIRKKQTLAELQRRGAAQMEVSTQFGGGAEAAAKGAASVTDIQERLAGARK